jgi:nucleotide-binding universal stress UspA family protein
MSVNKILIALNQSELSLKIVPSVEKLFAPDDCELILFYVTNPPGNVGFGEPDMSPGYVPRPGDTSVKPTLHPIYASQQEDNIRAHVKAELMSLTNRLEEVGYKVSVKVGFDKDPVEAISRSIKKNAIDMVAMSSRGRVGVTRFFFRNIADTLAQQEQLPVLLVHPPEE